MSGDKLAQKNDTAFMRRFFFLATGMMWSVMAIAGYSDYGRWYSNGSGIDTLFWGIVIVALIIGTIYALIQKLRTDKGWQIGGCLILICVASVIFIILISNSDKTPKQLYPTKYGNSNANNIDTSFQRPTKGRMKRVCPNCSSGIRTPNKVCSFCNGTGFVDD